MKIVGAYLLAVLGGNESPDAAAISTILDAVGITAEESDIQIVIDKLSGKDLDALIASGLSKMASVPSMGGGGGGGGGGSGGGGGGGGGGAAAAEAPKEEEKPKEKSEESENDMGFSLFD